MASGISARATTRPARRSYGLVQTILHGEVSMLRLGAGAPAEKTAGARGRAGPSEIDAWAQSLWGAPAESHALPRAFPSGRGRPRGRWALPPEIHPCAYSPRASERSSFSRGHGNGRFSTGTERRLPAVKLCYPGRGGS